MEEVIAFGLMTKSEALQERRRAVCLELARETSVFRVPKPRRRWLFLKTCPRCGERLHEHRSSFYRGVDVTDHATVSVCPSKDYVFAQFKTGGPGY